MDGPASAAAEPLTMSRVMEASCNPNGTRAAPPLSPMASTSRRSSAHQHCTLFARIRKKFVTSSETPTTPLKRPSMLSRKNFAPRRTSRTAMVDLQAALKMQNAIENRPWYVLSPNSRFASCWDGLTMLALLYTALVTPFEVSFLRASNTVDALFVVNRIIDLLFVLDMAFSFLFMYKVTKTAGITAEQNWVVDPKHIALHYLRGWFCLDLCSIVPSVFDVLPFVVSGTTSNLEPVKALRVIKALKLTKLLRLIRGSRILSRWQTRISISYASLTLCAIFVQILFTMHLIACLLALQTIVSEDKLSTWLGTFGYCEPSDDALNVELGDAVNVELGDANADECVSPFALYSVCIFWALTLIAGYSVTPFPGPYPAYYSEEKGPFTSSELVVLTTITFVCAISWVYVTAKFVDVISNANPDASAFRNTMDNLNRFISFNSIPYELAVRLREYYAETRQLQAARARSEICNGMSPLLQSEVALRLNEKWLREVSFFRGKKIEDETALGGTRVFIKPVEEDFLAQVALNLKAGVYAPMERPPRGRLYVIVGGGALYKGKVIGYGKSFGEIDVLLPKAPRQYRAIATTYLHVLYIEGVALLQLAEDFPESRKSLKLFSIYSGLKEYILHEYREHLKHQISQRDKELASRNPSYRALSMRSPTISRRNSTCSLVSSSVSRRQNTSRLMGNQVPTHGTTQVSATRRAGSVVSIREPSGGAHGGAQLCAHDGASAPVSRQPSNAFGSNGGAQHIPSDVSAAASKLRRELTDVIAAWEESWSKCAVRPPVRRMNSQVSAASAAIVGPAPGLAHGASASIPESPQHADGQHVAAPASAVAAECSPAAARSSQLAPGDSLPSQHSYRNFQQLEA